MKINTFLNNVWLKEKIISEIRKYSNRMIMKIYFHKHLKSKKYKKALLNTLHVYLLLSSLPAINVFFPLLFHS